MEKGRIIQVLVGIIIVIILTLTIIFVVRNTSYDVRFNRCLGEIAERNCGGYGVRAYDELLGYNCGGDPLERVRKFTQTELDSCP